MEHNNTRLIVTMTATSVIGLDAGTGEMYWRVEQMQGNKIHANSPVYSDGMIYCSSSSAPKSSGIVALVNMDRDRFKIKGKFKVPLGTDQHWSHPVIKDKRMYIGHGDALMVYDISSDGRQKG